MSDTVKRFRVPDSLDPHRKPTVEFEPPTYTRERPHNCRDCGHSTVGKFCGYCGLRQSQ